MIGTQGFLIAAPHSGSGKTTLALALMRAFKNRGIDVQTAKAGPDFIDPVFHAHASGNACVNFDPWAMRTELIRSLAAERSQRGMLIVEAMMGLFDGAADGSGSAADLAHLLGLPVVLVVDAAKQSHSIAALVAGFRDHRSELGFAGVILNKVGSDRHERMLRVALAAIDVPVFGVVRRDEGLALPSRHLGLVQAREHSDLETFVAHAASRIEAQVDLDALAQCRGEFAPVEGTVEPGIRPPGNRIAVAQDDAFAFSYPHLLNSWHQQSASLHPFSPLSNQGPDEAADAVFLPGGYPELHGGRLAGADRFHSRLLAAADRGAFIYGECGGYMVLGEGLIDADGVRHKMANLLPLVTSFKDRKLHLGYRICKPLSDMPIASSTSVLTAHEFHYSTIAEERSADRLFAVEDALGENRADVGMRIKNIAGSYMHLIDWRDGT